MRREGDGGSHNQGSGIWIVSAIAVSWGSKGGNSLFGSRSEIFADW